MPPPTSPSSPRPSEGSDWPAQVTDTIVDLVDSVRTRTTGPATTVVRGAVYGLLAGLVGLAVLVLTLIVLVRSIDIGVASLLDALGIARAGRSTWIAHTVVGLLFLVPGLWAWRRGSRPAPEASPAR